MAPKSDEIRGNTFESTELYALEEASQASVTFPMIHDLLLTSMTFHAALAGSGMIFVTPHIICVN